MLRDRFDNHHPPDGRPRACTADLLSGVTLSRSPIFRPRAIHGFATPNTSRFRVVHCVGEGVQACSRLVRMGPFLPAWVRKPPLSKPPDNAAAG